MADIFRTQGEWDEDRYDVADRTEIQGIGTTIQYCYESSASELELRLARNFTRLTFNAGQANDSPSSDEQLVVAVTANGAQLDIRRVPFDRIQDFSLDVTDVNALKIRLWLDEEGCKTNNAGVVAVVEALTLT